MVGYRELHALSELSKMTNNDISTRFVVKTGGSNAFLNKPVGGSINENLGVEETKWG